MFLRRPTQSRGFFPNSNKITHSARGLLRKARLSSLVIIVAAVGFALGSVQRAQAATYVVNSIADTDDGTCDSTSCTLREAINAANANSGADTITFSVTGTILLGSALPDLSDDVTISGPGANVLAVKRDAVAGFRIFTVNSGKTVTISGLSITNGVASGTPARGGGIYNDAATLTVNNCTISGNSAARGGGIENFGENSGSSASLTINNSTISGNTADMGGGIGNDGISGGSATLTVSNSTLSGNSVCSAFGCISGGFGGGIWNFAGTGSATLTVSNSTFSSNSAPLSAGGGIFNGGGSSTLTISSTILKAGASGPNIFSAVGTVTSDGYNLSSDDASAFLNQSTDQNSTDPMLGPLALNYGGPTPTCILKPGSPAINKGKNFSGATTDQRGLARTVGSAAVAGGDGTDIGAFERQASETNDIPTLSVTTTADTNANSTCDPASPCSLRDAITAANSSAPDDIIGFAATGTITLNTNGALPNLDSNMKILGPGANVLTVKRDSAASQFRIFTIDSGKTVNISGLTIRNGVSDVQGGGGILNFGLLTVSNCILSGNSAIAALDGGAIRNLATLIVNNSTLEGNSAGFGGGISNGDPCSGRSQTLTVNNSTLSGNSAVYGGGISNDGSCGSATCTISDSTFSGNSATGGKGGASLTSARPKVATKRRFT